MRGGPVVPPFNPTPEKGAVTLFPLPRQWGIPAAGGAHPPHSFLLTPLPPPPNPGPHRTAVFGGGTPRPQPRAAAEEEEEEEEEEEGGSAARSPAAHTAPPPCRERGGADREGAPQPSSPTLGYGDVRVGGSGKGGKKGGGGTHVCAVLHRGAAAELRAPPGCGERGGGKWRGALRCGGGGGGGREGEGLTSALPERSAASGAASSGDGAGRAPPPRSHGSTGRNRHRTGPNRGRWGVGKSRSPPGQRLQPHKGRPCCSLRSPARMGGQRVEASPPLPPNPESAAGASQPPAPHPEPSHKPTGVWIFCFLIGFKHNKLLIEGGGGDGVGGHRLLSKEEAELRGRVSTQRMELLPHGGLKITKGM